MRRFIADEAEMLDLGAEIVQMVMDTTVKNSPVIIYLKGQLGAGKTTLVRGFLKALGYSGLVKSPTYTLAENYQIKNHRVFHFDCYRIKSAQELIDIGLEDYLTADAICLIEWPEHANQILPAATLCCTIEVPPDGKGRWVNIN